MSVRLDGFGLVADKLDEAAATLVVAESRRYHPELSPDQVRMRVERSGTWDEHLLELAIIQDGRSVGSLQARRCDRIQFPGIYEIGLNVFDARDRGRGIGRRATALITTYLFEELPARRVQLTTDATNVAMRTVAERLGFSPEGTLRGFALTPEGQRDYVLYAMLRDDFEEVRDSWT